MSEEDDGKVVTKEVTFHVEFRSDLNPKWRMLPCSHESRERIEEVVKWMRELDNKRSGAAEYRAVRMTTKRIKTPLEL